MKNLSLNQQLRMFYKKLDDFRLYDINSPIFRHRIKELEQILGRYRDLFGKNALDIGCGGGISTFAIESLGLNAIGIDSLDEMINMAKKAARKLKSKAHFIVADAKHARFNTSFDSIFFLGNMIIHLSYKNLQAIIKNITKYMKQNSVFVFHYADMISELWSGNFFTRSPKTIDKNIIYSYNSEEGYISITIINKKIRDDLYEGERFNLYVWTPLMLELALSNNNLHLIQREHLPKNMYLDIYKFKHI